MTIAERLEESGMGNRFIMGEVYTNLSLLSMDKSDKI